jgi:hypothetical protein
MSCPYVIDIYIYIYINDHFSRCHMSVVNLICLSKMIIFLNLDVTSIFKRIHIYFYVTYV